MVDQRQLSSSLDSTWRATANRDEAGNEDYKLLFTQQRRTNNNKQEARGDNMPL